MKEEIKKYLLELKEIKMAKIDKVWKGSTDGSYGAAYNYEINPINRLLDDIDSKFPSDTCQVCGCNEFLCGHNKRGVK